MAEEVDEIKEPSLVAAGGELDRTAATTESLPQISNLEWGKAACTEDAIQKCVAAGAFHPGELIEWRAPIKDETPRLSILEDQFVILSLTHIICGLRLDASDFLVSVLNHYRLEWSHLTPNSITALSLFAHLCESYMEVPPTVEVFTHFYSLYRNMKGETKALGSVYFRLRDRMKKSYPLYYLKASQFSWVTLWFYAKVPQSCRLTFRCDALEEKGNWKDLLPLSPEQEKQVLQIMELSNQGLTGADIVHDYLKHRISPLRRRTHSACDYSGPSDHTSDLDKGLPVEDIESKLSYLLDLKKMRVKQPTNRPNVPTSLVRASANDHANQPLGLLNVPSTHEAKKKALQEITASIKTRKSSMITYKSKVRRASLQRYTRQSAGLRKVAVPPPLEIDPSPIQGSDPEEEILDAITNITTASSPNQGVEQKSIEHPAEVKEGKIAELTKPTFSVIGAKRKASAPRSRSQRRAKYSLLSVVTKPRISSLDTGSIKGTSSTKEAVLALNSRPLELAQCPPASLAEEAGNGALFVLANVVGSRPKVVEDSMSNVLLNQPVTDFSRKEVDPAQSISEIVREQEAIEVSPAIPVHNRKEINSEAIWEQMQKVQSEYVSFSVAASSELLEQAKKLVMENRRLKDRQIMLEQQVKDLEDSKRLLMKEAEQETFKIKEENIKLKDENKDLEDSRRLLTERMTEAEQEAFKIVEENIKLKDENKGQKQKIEELSKHNESTLGALVQKCTEANRQKEEAAQLIKEKEELQARVSRVNDLLKLVSSTLG
ncbi:uncharacterized protein LOC8085736 isoform X1 [Sorghum bicolor]|uniref:Transposase (putative) gypsy type domain-containing protein n=1 Tax=Sorghum bicolor TaxID=4558 RepID=A0A1B6PJP1_SORBI|nr:uncharacterized protein LOC8085736 isoform X1 [Sorghum bicolor]KXG25900.1 hypothetical protein SORBI_3006G028700 [Sorghum bicolor]|eukprot:XP_021319042.1 uncharacterized protein LOC8085736 isoform X1 [Sorghum bicolor]